MFGNSSTPEKGEVNPSATEPIWFQPNDEAVKGKSPKRKPQGPYD